MKDLISKIKEIYEMRESKNGKYRVLGLDKFDGTDWVHGEYNTAKEAIKEAEELTTDCMKYTSNESIATVFYAYDPDGNYIGGNIWNQLDPVDKEILDPIVKPHYNDGTDKMDYNDGTNNMRLYKKDPLDI